MEFWSPISYRMCVQNTYTGNTYAGYLDIQDHMTIGYKYLSYICTITAGFI